MQKNAKSEGNIEGLLKLRDAASQLGISFPTIKQWIYKKKIRSSRIPATMASTRFQPYQF
jgi:uncharacterized protein YjcR